MRKILSVITIAIFVFSTSTAFAGNDLWVGNTSVNFSESNWSGANNPPISGDSWEFAAAGTSGTTLNNDISGLSVAGITFDSGGDGFTLNGDAITLDGDITNNSSNTQTINLPIALGGDSTFTNGSTGALSISGGITGTGNLTLQNNGSTSPFTAININGGDINIDGTITNSGTGSGSVLLDSTVDSGVTAITEDSANSFLTIEAVVVNSSGTTLTDTLGGMSVNDGITGTGDLILNNNTSTDGAVIVQGGSVNNSGNIINSGTGTGDVEISGGVGSNVTGITENSSTSALLIDGDPITVNASGTTVTDTAGTLTVTSGVNGTGDLNIYNNSSTNDALSFTTNPIDNTGRVLNDSLGTGEVLISGGVGSNVDEIIQGSTTSDLLINDNPVTTGAGGTLFTVDDDTMTVAGGVTGTGDITLWNLTNTDDALSFTTDSINNSGSITNSGSGSGESLISGGVGSNVTGIIEDSATSALTISTNPIAVNASGTTLTDTAGVLTVSGGVSGTGDLILQNNSGTDDALSFDTNVINNSGTITNSGTSGETEISGGVGSNVTGITENGASSPLLIDTDAITVNTSGTTLTDTAGTLTVAGGVSGTGDLILQNNSGTDDALSFNTTSINNSGTITNSGSSGTTEISGGVGSNVTGITENSSSSALVIDTDPITVNTSGTTLTDTTGTLTVSGGVTGTGNLVINNNSSAGGLFLTTTSIDNTGSITNSGTGAGSAVISAVIGSDVSNVIEDSTTSSLIIANGSNTYSGPTRIMAGTLQTGATGAIPDTSDVSVSSGATLDLDGNSQDIGSLRGAGIVTSSTAGSVTLTTGTDDGTSTFSGAINDGSGQVALIEDGTGVLTLTGSNSYSGGTTINSGSSITVTNTNALGTGAVTNNGTLSLGTTNLTLGGAYTQGSGSTLNLTVSSPSVFGSITSTGHAAVVNAASTINVNVTGNIPNGTTFDIINTGGTGVSADPTTVDSNSARTSFIDSIVGDNLILTADTLASYGSLGNNPNARAIGTVLDNTTNGSSDMTNVLNTLSGLSNAQIAAALNTLGPIVDEGIIDNSTSALNNFLGVSLDRVENSLTLAQNSNSATGVSAGDATSLNGLWAKPYGNYLDQGTRQGIEGYTAWNAGTAIGIDHLLTDTVVMGVSAGYAYGQVNSDINSASTDINSAQGTVYAGYSDPNSPVFIDAAGDFAENWYSGQRDITVGSFGRTADSSFTGQQYGTYLGGGYKFNLGSFTLAPVTSLQWTHLDLGSYTESNAGALDLRVDRQSYDMLESSLGASVSTQWGDWTPELHAKWLYDFVNDDMVVTSAFTGGGASFTNVGASPAKDGADIGGKLSLNLSSDFSLIAAVDTELKDNFCGVGGSVSVRYKF